MLLAPSTRTDFLTGRAEQMIVGMRLCGRHKVWMTQNDVGLKSSFSKHKTTVQRTGKKFHVPSLELDNNAFHSNQSIWHCAARL